MIMCMIIFLSKGARFFNSFVNLYCLDLFYKIIFIKKTFSSMESKPKGLVVVQGGNPRGSKVDFIMK